MSKNNNYEGRPRSPKGIDPLTQLYVQDKNEEERKESDARYAAKIVERIVFGGIGFIALGALAGLMSLIFK